MENSVITMFIFHCKMYSRLTLLGQGQGPKRLGAARLGGKEASSDEAAEGASEASLLDVVRSAFLLSQLCATAHKVSVARKYG